MKINKKTILIISIFVITVIILSFLKQIKTVENLTENKVFDISIVVDNNWEKIENSHTFWFPKNDIVVIKNTDNYYQSKNSTNINNLSQKLISQGFTQDKNTSGLFGKTGFNSYSLLNFQKNNTWCQIEHSFEFDIDKGYLFACFDFDLNQSYEQQNKYYQLLPKDSQTKDYSQSIDSVQKNPNGYIKINTNTKSDSNVFIFDKNSKMVCEGKPCCDESSKGTKEIWDDDWCSNYQVIY
jgi:hypothetical protein